MDRVADHLIQQGVLNRSRFIFILKKVFVFVSVALSCFIEGCREHRDISEPIKGDFLAAKLRLFDKLQSKAKLFFLRWSDRFFVKHHVVVFVWLEVFVGEAVQVLCMNRFDIFLDTLSICVNSRLFPLEHLNQLLHPLASLEIEAFRQRCLEATLIIIISHISLSWRVFLSFAD